MPRSSLFVTIEYNPDPEYTKSASVNPAHKSSVSRLLKFVTCGLRKTSGKKLEIENVSTARRKRYEVETGGEESEDYDYDEPINSDDDDCAQFNIPKAISEANLKTMTSKSKN